MTRQKKHLALLVLVALVSLVAVGCAPPAVKIKVSRDEVRQGDPVTVSWEAKNAKTIELNGQKVEKIGARTVTPADTTNYEVVAKRGKKEAKDSATVRVNKPSNAPSPTVTLRAEPNAIEHGQNSTLKWSSENARTVSILGLSRAPVSVRSARACQRPTPRLRRAMVGRQRRAHESQ
jgi:hypothetical protein